MSNKSRWDDYLVRFGAMEEIAKANRDDIQEMKIDIGSLNVSRAKIIGITLGVSTVVSGLIGVITLIWS